MCPTPSGFAIRPDQFALARLHEHATVGVLVGLLDHFENALEFDTLHFGVRGLELRVPGKRGREDLVDEVVEGRGEIVTRPVPAD